MTTTSTTKGSLDPVVDASPAHIACDVRGSFSAIEAFQKDAGITVDGKYGPQTHDALEKATEEADFDWDKYAAIKEMQIEMADLGYYNGEIDGEYGPQTEDAIRAVQADCGITQDGIYGSDTHSCLLDLGGDA